MSNSYHGSCHDYTMLKEEFPPELGVWFDEHDCYVDLGFLGIQNDFDDDIKIPHKKSKKKELDELQKFENTLLSGQRIIVEHSIGGMKRYRILSQQSRIKNVTRYNQIIGICAALWNFHLKTEC